ncbi:MAG: alkaline phosphatase [Bacteroidales bacterium]|nr:alkaline phosphatase [Bacteroidales bacterium]
MKLLAFSSILFLIGGFCWEKTQNIIAKPIVNDPKNIILIIGDGTGLAQISAGFYNNNLSFSLESFPVIGFQKTYSANNLITDSAAAATAIASGIKTNNSVLGLNKEGKPVGTILEEARDSGFATGMVVTSSIQHATPGGFVAHRVARNLYEGITEDILNSGIDLFIGGGKQYFDRQELDDRNLIDSLKYKGYNVYDYFNNDINSITPDPNKKFAFFTADNQPLSAFQGRDYLPKATEMAAKFLHQRSELGFFLMVESSQIDWACHANQVQPLYDELQDFNKTIENVLQFAKKNGETLVIVTADHETGGLGLNPGSSKMLAPKFTTNGHTATMVPVFAFGPKSELFRGIYENTTLYNKMRTAFGFSEN